MNLFFKIVGALVVLSIATVLGGPSFVDWNKYKSEITEPVKELTGRNLAIAGDVSFTLLPAPAFSAHGLQFENIEGGRADTFAKIQSLEINVALLPLLSGRVDVTSITLNEPEIALEVRADGRPNWTFAPTGEQANAAKSTPQQDESAPIDISFDQVMINGGTVSYHDAVAGHSYRLEGVDAMISASSLDGPYAAKGEAKLSNTPVSFEVLVGNLAGSRAVPVSFSLGLRDAGAKLVFAGWASEATMDARLNGRLTVEGENLAVALNELARTTGAQENPFADELRPLHSPFQGEAQVVTSARELRVRKVSFTLGDSVATGSFQATFENEQSFEGNLDIASINLDRWIGNAGTDNPGAQAAGETDKTKARQPAASESNFDIPKNWAGTFKLAVGAVNYHGGVARQVGVDFLLGDGRLGVENASALLPGGSAIDLTGVFAVEKNTPRFNGRLQASSDNLRSLLSWLNVDTGAIPVDRLTRLTYSSSLDVTPDAVQIYGMEVALDTVSVTGGVSVALRDRLAFGVDFTLDTINLDTYLGIPSPSAKPSTNTGPAKGLAQLRQSLAGLEDVDAIVKLTAGKLTWRGQEVEKLALDLILFDGTLTINQASAGNYRGASGNLSGTATGFSRKPEGDLTLNFTLHDSAALQRVTGLELPYPISRLGAGEGILSFKGNEDRMALGLNGDFSGTRLEVDGNVIAPTALPALDMNISVSNPKFAKLVKQFDLPFDPPGGRDDGPISLSLSAGGKIDHINLRSVAEAGGGKLTIDGEVEQIFTDPTYRFGANLRGGDLRKFVRGLGVDFRPAAQNLGGLDVSLKVDGDHTLASLSGLKGKVGPAQFNGTATVRLTGDRPRLKGSLKISEVIVDLFMPPPTAGLNKPANASNGSKGVKPAPRWSREKIDLSFLNSFDGSLRIDSPGVVIGSYDFRDVQAEFAVEGGVATIKPLSARLFDGEAELSLTLDGRRVPALDMKLALTNADVAKAMTAAAGIDVVTGRAGFNGEFKTAGRSQFEMIGALGGGARVSAREGVIKGIDLRRLSDRLGNINNIPDVLGLVAGSLSGGQTAYKSVEGAIQVEKGVARTTDVRADIDAVDTSLTSEMNLVNWTMDTKARFNLTDHPRAPPLGIDLRGAIDNPVRDLKTRKLEGYLTKLIGTAILNKLTTPQPATSQPETSAPSPDTPAPPTPALPTAPGPEDVLRGILENLP